VEELATAQMEEEATSSFRAIDVGALTTLGNFACSPQKTAKMVIVHLDQLAPYQ
jgi:hypothetical protein